MKSECLPNEQVDQPTIVSGEPISPMMKAALRALSQRSKEEAILDSLNEVHARLPVPEEEITDELSNRNNQQTSRDNKFRDQTQL